MEEPEPVEPRGKRSWALGRVGAGLAMAVLLLGILWWRRANTLPPYMMARPPLPQPNAFDFCVCAADALRAVPGHQLARGRTTSTDYLAFLVEESRPALQTFRKGMAHPFVTPLPPDALAQRFQYLRSFEAISALLIAESRVAGDLDDVNGAVDRLMELVHLSGQVPRGGILDHYEEGCALEQRALAELAALGGDLDAPGCLRAVRRLRELDARRSPLPEAIARERDLVHEFLSGVARRDPAAYALLDLRLRWRWSPRPRIYYVWRLRGALRELERCAAEAMRQSTLPAGKRPPLPPMDHPLLERLSTANRLACALEEEDALRARSRLLRVDLALRACRLERGHAPSALSDLVPRYLPEVPHDPYGSGEPLRYRAQPEPFAYSIGPDRTDGGADRALKWRRFYFPYRVAFGDLVTRLGTYDLWQPPP